MTHEASNGEWEGGEILPVEDLEEAVEVIRGLKNTLASRLQKREKSLTVNMRSDRLLLSNDPGILSSGVFCSLPGVRLGT